MKKKLYIAWWVLVLAGWLVYGGMFVLTCVLPMATAPPGLTVALFQVGRAVTLILMAAGSYTLFRQWMGVIAALALGIVAALAQLCAIYAAIVLLAFPEI